LHLETRRAGTSISKNVKPEYLFNADQQKMLDKMPDVVSTNYYLAWSFCEKQKSGTNDVVRCLSAC
jgi:hypothetical protein